MASLASARPPENQLLPFIPPDSASFSPFPIYSSPSIHILQEITGLQQQQQFSALPWEPPCGSNASLSGINNVVKDVANSFCLDRTCVPPALAARLGAEKWSAASLDSSFPPHGFLALLSPSFPTSSLLRSSVGKKLTVSESWGVMNAAHLIVDLSKGGLSIQDPGPSSFQNIISNHAFAERAANFSCFNDRACLDLVLPVLSTDRGKYYLGSDGQFMDTNERSITPCSNYVRSSISRCLSRNDIRLADDGVSAARVEDCSVVKGGAVSLEQTERGSTSHSNEASVGQGDSSITEQGPCFQENPNQDRKCSRKSTEDSSVLARNGKGEDIEQACNEPKAKRLKNQRNAKQSDENKMGNPRNTACTEGTKHEEAPKPDYVHLRARRGEATDNHSLAERVRRGKISERLKFLQGLVPNCNKTMGKTGMLDEIINYVQSLQRQVEFLSMKLAALSSANHHSFENKERLLTEGSEAGLAFAAQDNSNAYLALHQPFHQHTLPVSCGLGVYEVNRMAQLGTMQTCGDTLLQVSFQSNFSGSCSFSA